MNFLRNTAKSLFSTTKSASAEAVCFIKDFPACNGCSHAKYPEYLKISQESLEGTVKPYQRHILICTTSLASQWLEQSQDEAEMSGISEIQEAKLLLCEWPEMKALERALIFPECKSIEIEKLKEPNYVQQAVDLEGHTWIFVCAHKRRDKRCGIAGPLLIDEFTRQIESLGLSDQVKVKGISHIGGHKFAGNVIIYKRGSPINGTWYGRVTTCHVSVIIEETIMNDKIIQPLWRGSIKSSTQKREPTTLW